MAAYTETLKESAKELFELTQNLVQQGHRKENRIWKNSLTLLYINNKMEIKYNFIHTHIKTKYLVLHLATGKPYIKNYKTLQGEIKLYKFREK